MSIDASIRITAIVDQAVKALRQVKSEAAGVSAAATAQGKAPFSDVGAGAKDAAAQTKAARDEAVRLRTEQRAAAAEAANQAAAAKKQALERKATADAAAQAQRAAANQARQLAPQLTDIFVGLSTGQSPFTVLLQQGGQLKDVMGGAGNAVKAVLSIFTVARVVVGAFAAVLGTVAYEAVQGRLESDALNKTIALTGNIANTSVDKLTRQASGIATSQKAAVGDVREALTALVSTGEFTATSLNAAGRAATALSKLNGQSAAETTKQFDGMSAGVAAWAAKSNQAYNFLTVEQFKYIQSLESQGRTQEAMRVTLDALADTMEKRSAPALGVLDKAWNAIKAATSGVLANLRAIGQEDTPEKQIAKLTQTLDLARAAQARAAKPETFDASIASIEASIAGIKRGVVATEAAATEKAKAEETAQQQILKQSKSYQDAASALTEAGVQKRLAEQLAALDKQQSAVELENARGLSSATAYSLALNDIEQKRLRAQAASIEQQIAIAAGKKTEKPQDILANQTQVKTLQAQLVNVRSQIQVAATQGLAIADADALDTARDRATQWGDVWQKAVDKLRSLTAQNGATAASSIGDPVGRAAAEAALKVADLRREVEDLQRELELKLSLTVDPSARAVLQQQITQLAEQSKRAIDDTTRTATLSSFQTQFGELTRSLELQEQRLQIAVDQGAITVIGAEGRKFDARARALPQLETMLRAMQAIATTPDEKNAVEALTQDVLKLRDATTEFQKSAKFSAIDSFSTSLSDIESGAKSAKEGLLDMVSSFGKAMIELINKRLASQLFDQFLQASSSLTSGSSGGFWASIISAFAGSNSGGSASLGNDVALAFHNGGVIGPGGSSLTRSVSPLAWVGAHKYHSGGIVGERPIIAMDGEEMLTEDNPRHIKNYKGGAAINGVNINVSVSGAQGSEADQRTAAGQLTQQVTAVIDDWAARQSRQGGILAKRN